MSETAAVYVPSAEIIQGSAEWHALRCGKFTASELHALVPTKGEGKGLASYIRTKVAERLSGITQGFEGNEDTDFGHEQEPLARRAYQLKFGLFLERVAFLPHPSLPYVGASPDGIAPDRGVEFKSHRKARKFLEAIEGAIPRAHLIQCQVGMACSRLALWDYNNWCPEMPERLRLHTRTVERDNALIAQIEVAARAAEAEVTAKVAEYLARAA